MTEEIKEILDDLRYTAKEHTIQVLENGGMIEHCPQQISTEMRLNNYSARTLLDYITNLQQDLDKANDIIEKDRKFYKCRMDEYVELKKENEKLKEYIKMYKCDYSPLYKELKQSLFKSTNNTNKAMEQTEIYKSRCEKAIEYIDNVEISYCRKGFLEDGILISKHVIKNILEGSDNNE